ncbi:hypothetical protein [Ketogulonicigenium vulgare]|uniref:hypothetical protein n=1 Tax=Ketogulonicigenium vulgare TaxID=92945 RepID=UPI002358EFCF|nr:hypothetical protein [Ketogulonicigenium vulgare]
MTDRSSTNLTVSVCIDRAQDDNWNRRLQGYEGGVSWRNPDGQRGFPPAVIEENGGFPRSFARIRAAGRFTPLGAQNDMELSQRQPVSLIWLPSGGMNMIGISNENLHANERYCFNRRNRGLGPASR